MKVFDSVGQLSMEGLITIAIGAIIYVVLVGFVFNPIFSALQPYLENQAGDYDVLASTLLLILIDLVVPLLLIVSAVQLVRPRVEIQQ